MTVEPEFLPPIPSPDESEAARRRDAASPPETAADHDHHGDFHEDQHGSFVVLSPELPLYEPGMHTGETIDPFGTPAGFYSLQQLPLRERLIPHLGHAAVFFFLALLLMITGEGLTVWAVKALHLFGNASLETLAKDTRVSIPSQAVEYLATFGLSALLFGWLWHRPFLEGIQWNAPAARKRVPWLVLLGIVAGFGVGFGGDFLPMPKDAPIVQDMMNTAAGAWLMFLFSFTGAPLMEELAFRGFLLPSLINAFRWSSDRGLMSTAAVRWVGVPISVVLTSCCFAMMHAPQVSHSWGPVLLIGIVSVVLCLVRLRLNSVLASAVVHSAYNFTLFAGILVTTNGFHHLEKLRG